MVKQATIIMAKVPAAGKVKTRLQPFLTKEQSAELAEKFLLDIENKIQNPLSESIIAFSPVEKKSNLTSILQHRHVLIEQKGDDLGERIYNAFNMAFAQDFERVVMIGTDSPTFPSVFIEDAFSYLENGFDVVLGETQDGGFYLIGFSILKKELFDDIRWSSENTSKQIIQNIKNANFSLKLLPMWYDIDLPADLMRLKSDLKNEPELAPHTTKWLKKI